MDLRAIDIRAAARWGVLSENRPERPYGSYGEGGPNNALYAAQDLYNRVLQAGGGKEYEPPLQNPRSKTLRDWPPRSRTIEARLGNDKLLKKVMQVPAVTPSPTRVQAGEKALKGAKEKARRPGSAGASSQSRGGNSRGTSAGSSRGGSSPAPGGGAARFSRPNSPRPFTYATYSPPTRLATFGNVNAKKAMEKEAKEKVANSRASRRPLRLGAAPSPKPPLSSPLHGLLVPPLSERSAAAVSPKAKEGRETEAKQRAKEARERETSLALAAKVNPKAAKAKEAREKATEASEKPWYRVQGAKDSHTPVTPAHPLTPSPTASSSKAPATSSESPVSSSPSPVSSSASPVSSSRSQQVHRRPSPPPPALASRRSSPGSSASGNRRAVLRPSVRSPGVSRRREEESKLTTLDQLCSIASTFAASTWCSSCAPAKAEEPNERPAKPESAPYQLLGLSVEGIEWLTSDEMFRALLLDHIRRRIVRTVLEKERFTVADGGVDYKRAVSAAMLDRHADVLSKLCVEDDANGYDLMTAAEAFGCCYDCAGVYMYVTSCLQLAVQDVVDRISVADCSLARRVVLFDELLAAPLQH